MKNHIDIKMSKSNHPIPVVDSVHLHSIYSPIREAESFIKSHEKKVISNNRILIFGLGFGYHLAALEERLKSLYSSYEINVIEPNEELINSWREYRPVGLTSRVRVINYSEIKSYFEDVLLTDFLSSKPSIISHTASFQLNEDFFKSFMHFSYPSDTNSSARFVENSELKNYLLSQNLVASEEVINNIESGKNKLKKWDFLTLALKGFQKQDER